jgi:hypothetical protein
VRRGVPPRIGELFRDDKEMAAKADLAGYIKQALWESENLIVVCSSATLFAQPGPGADMPTTSSFAAMRPRAWTASPRSLSSEVRLLSARNVGVAVVPKSHKCAVTRGGHRRAYETRRDGAEMNAIIGNEWRHAHVLRFRSVVGSRRAP